MSARIHVVEYGEPAMATLRTAIAHAQVADRLAPVTVVAPNPRAAVRLRHHCVRDDSMASGLGNVRFVVLSQLGRTIAEQQLRLLGRRPLNRSSLGAAVRMSLARHAGFLESIVAHPSTEDELVGFYEELRHVGDGELKGLSSLGRRENDLVTIHRSTRSLLEQATYDDVDLFEHAALAVMEPAIRSDIGSVIIHLPDRMRPEEARFLMALGNSGLLELQLGSIGQFTVDQRVNDLIEQCRAVAAVSNVELVVNAPQTESITTTLPTQIPVAFSEVVVAPDLAGECEEAVRIVMERLERGMAPETVAIAYPASGPYLRSLLQRLATAGIPVSAPSPRTLRQFPVGSFVLRFVRLATDGLTRSAVLEWMRATQQLDEDGRPLPIAQWDRCTRLAGITEGDAASWQRRLASLGSFVSGDLADLETTTSQASSTNGVEGSTPRRVRRARATAKACDELGRFIADFGERLDGLRSATTWNAYATTCVRAIEHYLGPLNPYGPTDETRVERELVIALLNDLSQIDVLDQNPSLEQFLQSLDTALGRPGPRIGTLGSGVVVDDIEAISSLHLETLVVLGCIEGLLPHRPPTNALISANARDVAGLQSTRPSETTALERRHLEIAVASATERIALMPVANASSRQQHIPSRFIDRALLSRGAIAGIGALDAINLGERVPATVDEAASAALLAAHDRGEQLSAHHLVRNSVLLGLAMEMTATRERAIFNRFSGRVERDEESPAVTAEPFSPTTLEQYAICPFRYFLSRSLGCEVVREPEQRLSIDPLDRGTVIHDILERFVKANLADQGSLFTETEVQGDEASATQLRQIAEAVLGEFERRGMIGKRVIWELDRRRILADVEAERQREADARHAAGLDPLQPAATEYAFGFAEGSSVKVEIGSRTLQFRGLIDRVDTNPHGDLRVIDYKTGNPRPFQGMAKDPLDRGQHLQLPVYTLAAIEAFGETEESSTSAAYRFVGSDAPDVEFRLDDVSMARFVDVLDTLLTSIESGSFPVNPGPSEYLGPEHCRYCDFKHMCPVDRSRLWESFRHDASVAAYADLTEPPDPDLDADD